jgi:hypothetical protein
MGIADIDRMYGVVCREMARDPNTTPETLQDILAWEGIAVSLSGARKLLGEAQTIALFKQLITDFAAANNNLRATIEDLQLLLGAQKLNFSVEEIKKYGHLALEDMVREGRNS